MAKRQTERQRLVSKIEAMDDSAVRDVLDYVLLMESSNRASVSKGPRDDELILRLVEAHENKRARQAFEWESVRRRAERRSTIFSKRT